MNGDEHQGRGTLRTGLVRLLRAIGIGLQYTGIAFGAPLGWLPPGVATDPEPAEDPPGEPARPLTQREAEAWAALEGQLRHGRTG